MVAGWDIMRLTVVLAMGLKRKSMTAAIRVRMFVKHIERKVGGLLIQI
jgi:hypothetical protein